MIDVDALIDGATNEILPDDVKARAVMRLALAQLLILKSPGHAVVATALPLVAGGPRRLVHALLSRAQKDGWALPATAQLPPSTADRWARQWGDAVVDAAAAAGRSRAPADLRPAPEGAGGGGRGDTT